VVVTAMTTAGTVSPNFDIPVAALAHEVTVVTDTSAFLPNQLRTELGISVVSLGYAFDDEPISPELHADVSAFYTSMRESAALPSSAPASTEDFATAYRQLIDAGHQVVSVHMSSGISDTCLNARRAAESLVAEGVPGDRITVIDSATTCGALGLIASAAARAAGGDRGPAAVCERATEARATVRMRFLLDTLTYLRRGGRIGNASAWVGSALSVKPILTVESEIRPVERVRTRERGIEALAEFARRENAGGSDAWVIQHGASPVDARDLRRQLQETFWRRPEFLELIGPSVGTHTGPGLLAVATMPARLLEP